MTLEFGSCVQSEKVLVNIKGKKYWKTHKKWSIFLMLDRDAELTERYLKSVTYILPNKKRVTKLEAPFLIRETKKSTKDTSR